MRDTCRTNIRIDLPTVAFRGLPNWAGYQPSRSIQPLSLKGKPNQEPQPDYQADALHEPQGEGHGQLADLTANYCAYATYTQTICRSVYGSRWDRVSFPRRLK